MPTPISSLQKLLAGEQIPNLPNWNPAWSQDPEGLKRFHVELENWQRKLHEYLRRLLQRLTGPNLFNEIIEQVGDLLVQYIIDNGGGGLTKLGFGPVKIEVFPGYVYVDGTTPFPGTSPIGTWWDIGLKRNADVSMLGFGREDGGAGEFTAVRISCKITPPTSENYKFAVQTDDFFRLYVDSVLVLDNWDSSSGTTADIALTAATPVTFVLEVVNTGNQFNWYVQWQAPTHTSGSNQDIPFSKISEP